MNRTLLKALIVALGTAMGLYGAYGLWLSAKFGHDLLKAAAKLDFWGSLANSALGLLTLGISLWCLFVGCMVWFRFSMAAVRLVLGSFALLAFVWSVDYFHPPAPAEVPAWRSWAWLGFGVLLFVGWWFASRRANRVLFPETSLREEQTAKRMFGPLT